MVRQSLRACWLVLGILMVAACPGRPLTQPTEVFSQIVITGPESIAPGAMGQFRAIGIREGRPSEDVTARVTWTAVSQSPQRIVVEPSPVLRFGSAGEALGLLVGEANVYALLSGVRSQARTVFVLPPGTFRVTGTAADPSGLLPFATVKVVSGAQAGMLATANTWGEFAFYGLSGTVTLQASAPGYETESRTITVSGPRAEMFQLHTLGQSLDLAGTWDLSISVPSACRSTLPGELWTRRQVATITTIGVFFDLVTPLSAGLRPPGARGRLAGYVFWLGLSHDDDYDHNMWEETVGSAFLSLVGDLNGVVESDVVRGSFSGSAFYRASPNVPFQTCSGPDGSFLMSRRDSSEPPLINW